MNQKINDTNKRVDELYLKNIGQSIMELIHNDPNNKQSIMLLHDEYKSK
jgi:hypothetical protein